MTSVFNGIFVIKHTLRDSSAVTFDFTLFFFFLSSFSVLPFILFFSLPFHLSHLSLFFSSSSSFPSFSPFSSQFVLSFFLFLPFPLFFSTFLFIQSNNHIIGYTHSLDVNEPDVKHVQQTNNFFN